jgi:hypothetical protein
MQNLRQPAQEETEVVAGGGEHGIDTVTFGSFEIVAIHAVLGLEMADDRLDGGSALHLAPDGGGGAADLAGDPDPELVGMVVAAIALVDMDAAGFDAGEPLDLCHGRPQAITPRAAGWPAARLWPARPATLPLPDVPTVK